MIQFKDDPEWQERHRLVMGALRALEDGKPIHQRDLRKLFPFLGPHEEHEAFMNHDDTTDRMIRGTVADLRGKPFKNKKGKRVRFRSTIPVISNATQKGGYRLPRNERDFIRWWDSTEGRERWIAQAYGWTETQKALERVYRRYVRKLGGNNGPDLFG